MQRYVYSIGALALLGFCMPVLAQGSYFGPTGDSDYVPVNGYFAGGYTIAIGAAARSVDNGWNVGGGWQWQLPGGPIALRLNFEYSRNDATHQLLNEGAAANQTQIDHGWSELWSNDFDAIFNIPLTPHIKAYVLGGGGGAIRRISLTQTVHSGSTVCNDWAGFCEAGGYPGNVLVDSKTTGRWEWNAGAGFNFAIGSRQSFFIEGRYIEVETPVPTRFIPIRVGLML